MTDTAIAPAEPKAGHLLTDLHVADRETARRLEGAVRRLAEIESAYNWLSFHADVVPEEAGDLIRQRELVEESLDVPGLMDLKRRTGARFERAAALYQLASMYANPTVLARHIREMLFEGRRALIARQDVRRASIDLAVALRHYCVEGPSDAGDEQIRRALGQLESYARPDA